MHGRSFAQLFGFDSQWKTHLDLAKATGDPTMPAGDVNKGDASYRYAVKWAEFVPRVYVQYLQLLAEMFAYSLAVAHLELPHQLMNTLMVSDIGARGWRNGRCLMRMWSRRICVG